jgi:branched-chain amino acid transport system permease protein
MKALRFYALTALGLAVFPFVIHPLGGYGGLATQILIVGIATIGFNLLLGYAGLLSYGQAMFYGVGGYVALLTVSRFFPQYPNFWLAIFLAVAFVTLMALVIGMLVVRLYGIYFALLTLAFAQMFFFIVFKWIDLTTAFPALDLGPFGNLSDLHYWYAFVAVVTLGVLGLMRALVASQFGETLGAIRENEERSALVGFDPRRYKLAAFVIAGALTGLSGALRGLYETSIAPDALTVETSGNFVVYTVIGGVKTLFGPLLGTGLVMYLQNVISAKTDAWRLIEGIIFVAVIVFLPGGILGTFRRKSARTELARAVRATPESAP